MSDKILDFEQDEIAEFDYITDFYIPFKNQERNTQAGS